MSDEAGHSEQLGMVATEQPVTKSACPHPEAVGNRWGDPIGKERQAELQGYLDRWLAETDHGKKIGPYDRIRSAGDELEQRLILTGADVFWIAEQSGSDNPIKASNMRLGGADLSHAHLEGAKLSKAHMDYVGLQEAYLNGSDLSYAHLDGAWLMMAHLVSTNLSQVHLRGATLWSAHLENAELIDAHLERAEFDDAHLNGANLSGAHLEGTTLAAADLEGANLTDTWFDKTSRLNDAILTGVSLDQVTFDNTNLTVVDWGLVDILGDELSTHIRKADDWVLMDPDMRLDQYKSAVRANRLLAVALHDQGMNEDADRFAYRAQLLQQQVLRRQREVRRLLLLSSP